MRKVNVVTVVLFVLFLFSFLLTRPFVKEQVFSEMENRYLKKVPSVSVEKVKDGSFMDEMESYTNDQFLFREGFTKSKVLLETARGRREQKGIIMTDSGRLVEKFTPKDKEQLQKNSEQVARFMERNKGLNSYVMLVPNGMYFYEEEMKYKPVMDSQKEALETVTSVIGKEKMVDVTEKLQQQKDEYLFYRSDHHWTALGAYYAYEVLAERMGFQVDNRFVRKEVSQDFLGTYWSKYPYPFFEKDTLLAYDHPAEKEVEVYYDGSKEPVHSLYNLDYLEKKDKYSYFLDGNHSLVKIKTKQVNKPKLVVFKDSYAHSFVPFLVPHFSEIHVIDLRYYYDDFDKYVKDNGIEDVLFLYNVDTFASDTNLVRLNSGK